MASCSAIGPVGRLETAVAGCVGPVGPGLEECAESMERRHRAHGAGRILEDGTPGLLVAMHHVGWADDRQDDRAARVPLLGASEARADRVDHAVRGRHAREERDDRVIPVLVENQVEIVRDELHVVERLGRDINRVARRGIGQRGLQPCLGRPAHRRHLETDVDRRVGHLHTDTARDRQQRDAGALRKDAKAGGVGDVQHLLCIARAIGTELPERGVVHGVRARQRRRVRPHRLGADRARPDLHEHDRLPIGPRFPEGSQQGVPIRDALGIGDDDRDIRLLGEPLERLRHANVGLVAGRDPVPNTNPALPRQ